jgi:RNA polymerase sigma-70 factor (ECF subfamily)
MSKFESLAARLPSTDERSIADIDREISEELEFHLQMRAEENRRCGVSPEIARRNAEIRFGNYGQIRNSCRRVLLGERIMWQRIQTALIAMLIVTVVGIGMSMYQLQRANNSALAELAAAVHELSKPSAARRPQESWLADSPHVITTSPAHSAKDVDPDAAEIRVTFDRPMTDKSWSWVRSSSNDFPETTGEVHYLDDLKTCVMPVRLEPGKTYCVWFNNSTYQNFKDADGRPAVPYLLNFTTSESKR